MLWGRIWSRILRVVVVILAVSLISSGLEIVETQVPVGVAGYVYMPDGSPAVGAKVKVTGGGDTKTTTTNSKGKYAVTLTVSSTPVKVTVTASKDGYTGSASKTGEGTIIINVYLKSTGTKGGGGKESKKATKIYISLGDGFNYSVNDTVILYGEIFPHMSASVNIVVTKPSGDKIAETVLTSSNGSFLYNFTLDEKGEWCVFAQYSGDNEYSSSKSNTLCFSVKIRVKVLTQSVSSLFEKNYSKIIIFGRIRPAVPFVPIQLYMSFNNASWYLIEEARTDNNGSYSFDLSFPIYGILSLKVIAKETEETFESEGEIFIVKLKPMYQSQLNKEIKFLNEKLREAEDKIKSLSNEVRELNNKIKEKEMIIDSLKNKLAESNNTILSLKEELSRAEYKIEKNQIMIFIVAIICILIGSLISYVLLYKFKKPL